MFNIFKKLVLPAVLIFSVAGCSNIELDLTSMTSSENRSKTLNDDMQAFMGKNEMELVSAWGTPDETFNGASGSRMLVWKRLRTKDRYFGSCIGTFMVNSRGIITGWKYAGDCVTLTRGSVPKATPVPPPTMK